MKTIGIIGGMGPMATVDLMQKIILATDAREDQEHIHLLIDNNTDIPDRTAAILGQGTSPVPELLKSADRLTAQGADFLIMGCNTAHFFLPLMMPFLKIPFISMIEATAEFCSKKSACWPLPVPVIPASINAPFTMRELKPSSRMKRRKLPSTT